MTRELSEERPSCEEILEEKHLWALDHNDFEFENELTNVLNSKISNEKFIHFILELKFIDINNKFMDEIQLMNEKETRITSLLKRYKHGQNIVRDLLMKSFDIIPKHIKPRKDLIEFLINLLKQYRKLLDMNLIGIRFLHKWTEGELMRKLDKSMLENVLEVTMRAMKLFPYRYEILQFCGLILFNDHILQNVSFERYQCLQIVMYYIDKSKNTYMIFNSPCLCQMITFHLSKSEKENMASNPAYMETLLDIVERCVQSDSVENNIEHIRNIFSIFKHLTNDAPNTCELLEEKGLIDMSFIVLKVRIDKFDLYHFPII
jgi:hypothetical protein